MSLCEIVCLRFFVDISFTLSAIAVTWIILSMSRKFRQARCFTGKKKLKKKKIKKRKNVFTGFSRIILFVGITVLSVSCNSQKNEFIMVMNETRVSFSEKNHALDNNDNFSPYDRFLCYDTRGTVYNENLANCKSIEKVEVGTSRETVLWEPESVTGEEAA